MRSVPPKRNCDYWEPKLQRNVEGDREAGAVLRAAGWQVLRFWEHEQAISVTVAIREAIAKRRDSVSSPRAGATNESP